MHPRNATNEAAVCSALQTPRLAVARLVLQQLPFEMQVRAAVYHTEVLVGVFGASLAWMALLPAGAFVVQMHVPPSAGASHFGSCRTLGPDGTRWGANDRSEWGAWARAIGVQHACVAIEPADPQ